MFLNKIMDMFGESASDETVKRDTIVNNIDAIYKAYDETTVDKFKLVLNYLDEESGSEGEKRLIKYFKEIGIKHANTPKRVINDYYLFLEELRSNESLLIKLIYKYIPKALGLNVVTAKQAALLGEMETVFNAVLFIDDFLLQTIYVITGNEEGVYKSRTKDVADATVTFMKLYTITNGKYKQKLNSIHDLSDVEISDIDIYNLHSTDKDGRYVLPTDGFYQSTLFTIQKFWIDFNIERYKAMKDKRDVMVIMLSNLKSGNLDASKQEAIEYYEDKIKKYDAKIHDFEES